MAIPKKIMNFCYGMGAAVVIIGALFKITHIELGSLNGNNMLTVGLVVEALIFAISAFEPVDEELDWSRVYPELKGGTPRAVQVAGNVGVTGTVQNSQVGGTPVQVSTSSATPAAVTYAQHGVVNAEPPMEKTMLSSKL